LISGERDGIFIPIPQYPLYSAAITLQGGSQVGYYLKEDKAWGTSVQELEHAHSYAIQHGIVPKALVSINPGNPTGQVLTAENMKEIIDFCWRMKMVLLADEVYQENVYVKDVKSFHSYKKVLMSMGPKYKDLELISFHSVSKGFIGECGHRGGYLEAWNIDPEVKAQIYKLASINLSSNTPGQLLMSLMTRPPKQGEESYPLYAQERDNILNSLKRRAEKLTKFFNSLEGVSCNSAEGAMYAFPKISLSQKAIEAAKEQHKAPDTFYSLNLLESTGVVVVPGSGFGQRDGTFHFRTTFLPPEKKIDSVMEKMGKFHANFMTKYK